jgi:hypothetical protein
MVTGKAEELVTHVQLRTGGMVSTTVMVWLHWSWLPQSSTPCQVRVMIWGQVPLVTVPMTETTTPLLGVPGGGEQAFVQVGGLNVHVVPHWTVLLLAQSMAKVQPAAGVTTNGTTHWVAVPRLSTTVNVM